MRPVVRPVVPTRAAAALPRTAAVPIRTSAVVPDAIPTVVTGWASRTKAIRWRLVLPRDGARHARVTAVDIASWWHVVSVQVPTDFLQPRSRESISTAAGEDLCFRYTFQQRFNEATHACRMIMRLPAEPCGPTP